MKTDPYTKFILTVIAICLLWICARHVELVESAHAQSYSPEDVVKVKVEIVNRESIPVFIENSVLPPIMVLQQ